MSSGASAENGQRSRWIAHSSLAVALGLLLLTLLDIPARGGRPIRTAGADLPGYDFALLDGKRLLAALAGAEPDLDAFELNALVFESLAHGDPRPIAATDNWLSWGLGLIGPDLRLPQRPRRLARGGVGLCSDAVIILAALARERGYEADMLGLNGHVILHLARAGGEWICDPDLGLVWSGSLADLCAPAGLQWVEAAVLAAGHPAWRAAECRAVLASGEDNTVIPAGVLNPRLARLERWLDVFRWAIPSTLLLVSLWTLLDGTGIGKPHGLPIQKRRTLTPSRSSRMG